MGALFILLEQFCSKVEYMIMKNFGNKYGSGGMSFNAVICFFSMLFFIITDKGGLCFTSEIFIYGLISSMCYAAGFYALYASFKYGSFAMTNLTMSFSGVFSIGYGIIFLKEPASVITYIAIAMVFLSVVLMKLKKSDDEESTEGKNAFKWTVFAIINVLSNGAIAIISRMQQIHFNSAYDNEFLTVSLGGAFIILLVLSLFLERDNFKMVMKNGLLYGSIAGVLNGGVNLCILATYLYIPISVASPIKTGLGQILSFLISVVIYKETFTKRQILSAIVGIVALVLFKLA